MSDSAPTPTQQATTWLAHFGAALERADIEAALALFDADSYWRDLVSFTWNITTLEGQDAIRAMLKTSLPTTRPSCWQILGEAAAAGGVTDGPPKLYPRKWPTKWASAGGWDPTPAKTPAPGKAKCATCGSRPSSRRSGSMAGTCINHATTRSSFRSSSKRAWKASRRRCMAWGKFIILRSGFAPSAVQPASVRLRGAAARGGRAPAPPPGTRPLGS